MSEPPRSVLRLAKLGATALRIRPQGAIVVCGHAAQPPLSVSLKLLPAGSGRDSYDAISKLNIIDNVARSRGHSTSDWG